MIELYNETCFECSKVITRKYSTSFSLGIKAFDRKFHYPIYAVYGFVRYADEIVDSFHQYDKVKLISKFRDDTFEAIDNGISLNPVLHSFQLIVKQYGIDLPLIDAFLKSMEMDLDKTTYSKEGYDVYIYGSAEVIGLMCLKIFCEGDGAMYQQLIPGARKLGAAFQKVNFLRDIKSDFLDRGRVYFPGINFSSFSIADKQSIEKDIQQDFDDSLLAIRQLPESARKGVYIAYVYYLELFRKIKNSPLEIIAEKRVRVSDKRKLWLMAQALVTDKLRSIG
ncbi:squalene/phytoene synthase family protein [Pedobacter sp. HMF7647]|uniref:Squalene/phytoene synthase family protein n=1 Tax=Hufsiella arboris TaxID=2695275 RepID=A0A7K1YEY0_9SPHI|nr:phytoene/squalene synthase family protein [Hufsiella arboris]MXV52970.1 squalene/phytoene synthase family protein [Hufsiella arboris]